MKVEQVDLHAVQLPLVSPFETSFGKVDSRTCWLVAVRSDGIEGWGECVADEDPGYSPETNQVVFHILRDFLIPKLLSTNLDAPEQLTSLFASVRGHNMAKASLEMALWDWFSRAAGQPLFQYLGGSRPQIGVGVSVGIQPSIKALLDSVDGYLRDGYQRIKIKIKKGWDLDPIQQLRQRFPDISLMADANSAYALEDASLFKALDEHSLMMIEQPLAYYDILDHAVLQQQIRTPLCLDESIHRFDDARHALSLRACRIINIKPGRVGGHQESRRIEAHCRSQGAPVWCGGMLETGIGRAHNLALASLPGFTLPGDTSDSRRYFDEDLTEPRILMDKNGTVPLLPDVSGIGYMPVMSKIRKFALARESFRSQSTYSVQVPDRIEYRPVRNSDEYAACVDLQRLTWGSGFAEVVPQSVFALLQKISGVVLGAFTPSKEIIGFALSFPGLLDGEWVQWSDMLAVHPNFRDQNIGFNLKTAQRQESLAIGCKTIVWTFDPLESRNAYLNLRKLGVTASQYFPDFYGTVQGTLLGGLATDRLLAVWDLPAPPRKSLLDIEWQDFHNTFLPLCGLLRDVPADTPSPPVLDLKGPHVMIEIPPDLQDLKKRDMQTARSWRTSTRLVFQHYLKVGFKIVDYGRWNTPAGQRAFYHLTILS